MIDELTSITPAGATPAATRFYVEQDGDSYVYRVVDAATGRLLLEAPREQAHTLTPFVTDARSLLASATA